MRKLKKKNQNGRYFVTVFFIHDIFVILMKTGTKNIILQIPIKIRLTYKTQNNSV